MLSIQVAVIYMSFIMPPPPVVGRVIMFSGRLSVRPSVRLSVIRPSVRPSMKLFRITRSLLTWWTDFNETCHKYSSCESDRALLKRFSNSEVEGHGHF